MKLMTVTLKWEPWRLKLSGRNLLQEQYAIRSQQKKQHKTKAITAKFKLQYGGIGCDARNDISDLCARSTAKLCPSDIKMITL